MRVDSLRRRQRREQVELELGRRCCSRCQTHQPMPGGYWKPVAHNGRLWVGPCCASRIKPPTPPVIAPEAPLRRVSPVKEGLRDLYAELLGERHE